MAETKQVAKPRTIAEAKALMDKGYLQHPVTKEWLPRDQVIAFKAAQRAAKSKS